MSTEKPSCWKPWSLVRMWAAFLAHGVLTRTYTYTLADPVNLIDLAGQVAIGAGPCVAIVATVGAEVALKNIADQTDTVGTTIAKLEGIIADPCRSDEDKQLASDLLLRQITKLRQLGAKEGLAQGKAIVKGISALGGCGILILAL